MPALHIVFRNSNTKRTFQRIFCIQKGRGKMAIVKVTESNFEQEVLQAEGKVLVDFWAVWCGPCQMLSPIVDEVAAEAGNVKVGKVNVDEEPALAAKFGVMSIPTLLVFENGKVVKQSIGYIEKDEVMALIQ